MKKLVLIALSAIAMATTVGCDKKEKNNDYGYGYGPGGYGYGSGYGYAGQSCFNGGGGYNNRYNSQYGYNNRNGYNYNNRNRYNTGYGYANSGVGRYQYINGDCIDVQTDQLVAPQRCERNFDARNNRYNGYSNSCNFYGGNPYGNWGNPNPTACSVYDRPGESFYPVYYPETGQTVCVGFSTFNNFSMTYGTPLYWNNTSGVYWGCTPGVSSCNCRNFGGTLGWASGGVSVGWCY